MLMNVPSSLRRGLRALCLASASLALAPILPSTAAAADGTFLAAGSTGGIVSSRLPSVQYVPRVGFIRGDTVFYGTGGLQRMRDYEGEGGGALGLGVGVRHSLREPSEKRLGTFLLGQLQTTVTKGTHEELVDVLEHDKLRTVLLGGGVEAELTPLLTLSGELVWKQSIISQQGTIMSEGSLGSMATGLFLNCRL